MATVPLMRSSAGVDWSMETTDDGRMRFVSAQDVYEILEQNKAMFNANDGYNWGRDVKRAASIPSSLRLKWLIEEGWDAWRADLYWDRLKRKLNDPEYRFLRTAGGRL